MSISHEAAVARPVRPQILLVEDDEDLRVGLAQNLRLNGMAVHEADCGAAFHEARRKAEFDVAVLDVNLSDANGFELAASMANDRSRPGIIMLTARTSQEDRIRGYSEGADLYMTKPVLGAEFLLAVRNLANRITQQRMAAPADGAAGWRLVTPMRRLVSPDGSSLALSGREILLLSQFVGRKDEILSRQMLSENLGYGTPDQENRALDAVLRRLQRKFADAGMEQPIVSVNNVGVLFSGVLTSD